MGLISLVTTIDAGENVTGVTVAEVSGMIQWSYTPALTKTGVIWTRHFLGYLSTFGFLQTVKDFEQFSHIHKPSRYCFYTLMYFL